MLWPVGGASIELQLESGGEGRASSPARVEGLPCAVEAAPLAAASPPETATLWIAPDPVAGEAAIGVRFPCATGKAASAVGRAVGAFETLGSSPEGAAESAKVSSLSTTCSPAAIEGVSNSSDKKTEAGAVNAAPEARFSPALTDSLAVSFGEGTGSSGAGVATACNPEVEEERKPGASPLDGATEAGARRAAPQARFSPALTDSLAVGFGAGTDSSGAGVATACNPEVEEERRPGAAPLDGATEAGARRAAPQARFSPALTDSLAVSFGEGTGSSGAGVAAACNPEAEEERRSGAAAWNCATGAGAVNAGSAARFSPALTVASETVRDGTGVSGATCAATALEARAAAPERSEASGAPDSSPVRSTGAYKAPAAALEASGALDGAPEGACFPPLAMSTISVDESRGLDSAAVATGVAAPDERFAFAPTGIGGGGFSTVAAATPGAVAPGSASAFSVLPERAGRARSADSPA
jgi:hypothetical protein